MQRKEGDLILDVRVNEVKRLGKSRLSEKQYREDGQKYAFRQKIPKENLNSLSILLKSVVRFWKEEVRK